jgi:hypothetical protein
MAAPGCCLWRGVHLYHILVIPEHCRRSYASALNAAADLTRATDCTRLALNVFALNKTA